MHLFLHSRNALCLITLLFLSGCVNQQVNTKSSVMDYLYPNSSDTFVEPATPHLNLPLRVGVAFVPEHSTYSNAYNFWTGQNYSASIPEAEKRQILEQVASEFRGLEFVGSIEVIPTSYLTPGGSFANLSQIRTMYGIDVIALVSYDQVQFTDEDMLSLSYWTIVGAYVVSGEKNDTSTLLDTVVYDIASKKMLFRAPGTSQVSGRSTPVNLSEELREDSLEGFALAAKDMTANLQQELTAFKEKIKANPEQVQISHREGYRGGSAMGLLDIALLFSFALFAGLRRRGRAG